MKKRKGAVKGHGIAIIDRHTVGAVLRPNFGQTRSNIIQGTLPAYAHPTVALTVQGVSNTVGIAVDVHSGPAPLADMPLRYGMFPIPGYLDELAVLDCSHQSAVRFANATKGMSDFLHHKVPPLQGISRVMNRLLI